MKKMLNVVLVAIIVLLHIGTIDSFAQIDSGKDFDLQRHINREVSKGKKEILVPPGRYRLTPKGNRHLLLQDLKDVTILAKGVELICTETVQAINIINCKNLKLVGLSIDYDPLPFTQGKIVEISPDKTTLTVDIIDGYSTNLRNEKLEIFDPVTAELVTRTYYGVTYEVDNRNRRVVFNKKTPKNDAFAFEDIGDIVVFDSYNTRFAPHAVVMEGCEKLTLENVCLYAGPTFAFFERSCNGSKYIGCKVDRRPLETDLVKRGVRRMRSNNADGFHSKSAQIGPSYRNCVARYNGDDGFAISGNYHVITETNGNLLTVVGKAGFEPDVMVGDPVELVSYDGTRLPDATVKSIKSGRALNLAEKVFLSAQKLLRESGKTKDAENVYVIEVDRAINLPMGSVIASSNRVGNGFEVVDCIAGPNRSRGIISKASNGTIANNRCVGNWGMAIKCSPEHQWLEAGSGNNLTITNNTIENCQDVGIAVYAIGGNGKTASLGAHNNVNISDNVVLNSLSPAFAITSTTGLIFMNNKVKAPTIKGLDPSRKQFGRSTDPNRSVFLENVTVIKENFGLPTTN
ncbi:MAG: right-handed parallel beta-helix repeat-containing protein [Bacteroidetes bacterium]|nr:MAG: right-handed parallel beta-helix repeat-containing protein [Bacteroidota bacterium]